LVISLTLFVVAANSRCIRVGSPSQLQNFFTVATLPHDFRLAAEVEDLPATGSNAQGDRVLVVAHHLG
jgi:hypothetical protein